MTNSIATFDGVEQTPTVPRGESPSRRLAISATIFLFFFALYHANGDTYLVRDHHVNALVAESVLHDGDFWFSAEEAPEFLTWWFRADSGLRQVSILRLDDALRDEIKAGRLWPDPTPPPRTAVLATPRAGEFISIFPPGTALTALPGFWLAERFLGPLEPQPLALVFVSKAVASACVALSAVFLFWTLAGRVSRRFALLLTLAYGMGTSVWAISSQSLGQHGPNEMYLSIAIWALLRRPRGRFDVAIAAVVFSAATCCRLTSGLVALAGLAALRNRRECVQYIAFGLPLAIALSVYNAHFFGKPWSSGESAPVADVLSTTGQEAVWATPMLEGLAGLLLSPSRGLLIYSPWLVFALPGMWLAWRERQQRDLLPWAIVVVLIFALHAKYYDWWGGRSFAYRPVVDTVGMLTLFLLPSMRLVARMSWGFGAALAWSMAMQVVGAFTFDPNAWDLRKIESRSEGRQVIASRSELAPLGPWYSAAPDKVTALIPQDFEQPQYHWHLWSVRKCQGILLASQPGQCRKLRRMQLELEARRVGGYCAESHSCLGRMWLDEKRFDDAQVELARAQACDPTNPGTLLLQGLVAAQEGDSPACVAALQEAFRWGAQTPEAWQALGAALLDLNRPREAAMHLQIALVFRPDREEWKPMLDQALSRLQAASQ